jgi:hypothetical protein
MTRTCPTGDGGTLEETGYCPRCWGTFPVDADGATTAATEPPADNADDELNKRMEVIRLTTSEDERARLLEAFEERVLELYEEQHRLVTFIGFSTTGKTFLANRLRRELRLQGWNVRPSEQDAILKTAQKIDYTRLIREGRPIRKLVLADCDGEAYQAAVDKIRVSADDAMRRYCMLITAAASAYVLILPADLRADSRDEDLAKRFHVIVDAILAVQYRLRDKRLEEVIRAGFDGSIVDSSMEHAFWCDKPLIVLFTQADRFPELAHQFADPLAYAMTHAKDLFRTVHKRFRQYRFDFVSAFAGHDGNLSGAVDYELPHSGAVDAFDWIDRTIASPRSWHRQTATAVWARRVVDPEFRQLYARTLR